MTDAAPPAAVALTEAAQRLAAVSDTPRLDAELLLAHALGIDRDRLLLDLPTLAVPDGFAGLVAQRLTHAPIAYLVGYRDFWTVRLAVGPGVLVPRPDSETLIDVARLHWADTGPRRILDLGTGPGTLLLAALDMWPDSVGVGVERSAAARSFADRNVAALGLADRAHIVAGDWHDAGSIRALGRFSLIVSNPPYVRADALLARQITEHEPAEALFAGPDGLADYRAIVPLLPGLLEPDGLALLEIGHDQAADVAALAGNAGFCATVHRDLGGRDRVVALKTP